MTPLGAWVALRGLPTSTLADALPRGLASGALQQQSGEGPPLCGPAFTVQVEGGRNAIVKQALQQAPAGAVLVVAAEGAMDVALVGEILTRTAQARGLAGVVVDGAVRDRAWLARQHLPVYARGTCPQGPRPGEGGQIGGPVSLAGITVQPGDIVCGDADGVVVVPPALLPGLADAVANILRDEARRIEAIAPQQPPAQVS